MINRHEVAKLLNQPSASMAGKAPSATRGGMPNARCA